MIYFNRWNVIINVIIIIVIVFVSVVVVLLHFLLGIRIVGSVTTPSLLMTMTDPAAMMK